MTTAHVSGSAPGSSWGSLCRRLASVRDALALAVNFQVISIKLGCGEVGLHSSPNRDTSQERNIQRYARRLTSGTTIPTYPRYSWEALVLRLQPALSRSLSGGRVCILYLHKIAKWLGCL